MTAKHVLISSPGEDILFGGHSFPVIFNSTYQMIRFVVSSRTMKTDKYKYMSNIAIVALLELPFPVCIQFPVHRSVLLIVTFCSTESAVVPVCYHL